MALAERLRISPGVPLLLAAFVWLASPLLLGAILSAAVCHELGHWLVLRRVGGRIQRLHITVFGAEMQVDDRRISYGGELLTAAAGPVSNLLLAAAMVFFRDIQFLWGFWAGAGSRSISLPGRSWYWGPSTCCLPCRWMAAVSCGWRWRG